jgi:hypothetical protein
MSILGHCLGVMIVVVTTSADNRDEIGLHKLKEYFSKLDPGDQPPHIVITKSADRKKEEHDGAIKQCILQSGTIVANNSSYKAIKKVREAIQNVRGGNNRVGWALIQVDAT